MTEFPPIDFSTTTTTSLVDDSTSDFLAREQAILGEDAARFGGINGSANELERFPDLSTGDVDPTTLNVTPSIGIGLGLGNEFPPVSAISDITRAQQTIDEREERNREKHEKTIEQAHADIDRFYEDYNAKKINILKQNEIDEAEFLAERERLASGTTWERVCKILGLTSAQSKTPFINQKDVTRFKELLLSLKSDENAPGAAGY
ncbi:4242_t:CDS:2 [Paraglomus brasilianum]|uniref:Clathrin light chain n=1 Tax=Paraglomus brasilianum TaxID=144538 RepID=A0A9N9FJL7_9GLOM|nr:4242_t:CDS:2 [Paraglomus brasilianum]